MNKNTANKSYPTNFQVKSLHDPEARLEAARIVKSGEPVGIYNRGVCAIWGDGNNYKFYKKVTTIKGEKRAKRPLATTLRTSDFIRLIDDAKIPPSLHSVLLDAGSLAERIGSLCFLRMPIKKEFALKFPDYIVSQNTKGQFEMQNWDAAGHSQTHSFIELLLEMGVTLPAVTSMNYTGSPEIVDQDEGIEFAKKAGIKLFLIDEKDPGVAKGSFTILGVGKNGLTVIRDGHVPGHVFPYLLEVKVDTKTAIPAKFPQIAFPDDFFIGDNPIELRKKVINYISSGHH